MCVEAPESTNHSEELGGYCCGTPVDWSVARKAVDGAGGELGDACCWANMAWTRPRQGRSMGCSRPASWGAAEERRLHCRRRRRLRKKHLQKGTRDHASCSWIWGVGHWIRRRQ